MTPLLCDGDEDSHGPRVPTVVPLQSEASKDAWLEHGFLETASRTFRNLLLLFLEQDLRRSFNSGFKAALEF
jgi:hypothetical protein